MTPPPVVASGPSVTGPSITGPAVTAPLVYRTWTIDNPGDLLDHLGHGGFAWLTDGAGFVTSGVAARIRVRPGPGRYEQAAAEVAELLGSIARAEVAAGRAPMAVGALPFDDRLPGELVVPARMVGTDRSGAGWVTEIGPEIGTEIGPGRSGRLSVPPAAPNGHSPNGHSPDGSQTPAKVFDVKESTGREQWMAAVRRVLSAISTGEVRKVVLARELLLEADAPFDRRTLLERLRRQYPSCFVYAAGGFLGASPELLVRRSGDEVRSCPMAGTVRRGTDPAEDDRLVAGLRRSAKEAQEHELLVEAVLEALAPVCAEPPQAGPAEVIRLTTVSHLATVVSARLAPPAPSALALAGRLHPTPAVGGLPRVAALEAIARLEDFDRGLYAGPVGWVDANGDGEWAVALRGAEVDGVRARLVAGAGIVAGSDPEAEWAETEAKLEAMLGAFRP